MGAHPDGAAAATSAPGVFDRAETRHRFTARRAHVVDIAQVAPDFVRIRLAGPDLADFVSDGPADHVRVYFPDPATGVLVAPESLGSGEDGLSRPDGDTFARDFTPLPARGWAGPGVAVDLDFFLHPSPGPASAWAAAASFGDELVLAGPRASRAAPQLTERVVLVCDETALPSATRWAADVPAATDVAVIAATHDGGGWVTDYLRGTSGREDIGVTHVASSDDLVAAVAAVGVDAGTYVFAAGEASALVPLRRHLRADLGLSPDQVALSGYWKAAAPRP